MPYIKQERRENIAYIARVLGDAIENEGELNFAITTMLVNNIKRTGPLTYSRIAMITGVLENVKQEFYRRVAVPYEDAKIVENGDVY